MKKIFATLLCVVLSFSLFTVTSFAASYSYVEVSDNDVAEGDTFTVTVSVPDMAVSGYSTGINFDKNVLECTSLVGADPAYPDVIDLYSPDGRGSYVTATAAATKDEANEKGVISATWAATAVANYEARAVFTATFKVKDTAGDNGATTTSIILFEDRTTASGTEVTNPADTKVISIASDAPVEPEKDETITGTDAATGTVEADKTKTWTVTVGKDLVGQALKATLTNSAAADGNKTQEVDLTFADDVQGGASLVFNVKVKFIDFANAETTTLKIEKAN